MVLTSDTTDEPWYYNSTFMWESLNVSATLTATLLVYEAPHNPDSRENVTFAGGH